MPRSQKKGKEDVGGGAAPAGPKAGVAAARAPAYMKAPSPNPAGAAPAPAGEAGRPPARAEKEKAKPRSWLGEHPGNGWVLADHQPDDRLVLFSRTIANDGVPVTELTAVGVTGTVGPVAAVKREGERIDTPSHIVCGGDQAACEKLLVEFSKANPQYPMHVRAGPTNHSWAAATRSYLLLHLISAVVRAATRVYDVGGAYVRWDEVRRPGTLQVHCSNPRFGPQPAAYHGMTACACSAPSVCAVCLPPLLEADYVFASHSMYFEGVRRLMARAVHRTYNPNAAGDVRPRQRAFGIIDKGLDLGPGEERLLHQGTVRAVYNAGMVDTYTDSRAGEPRYSTLPTGWFTAGVEHFEEANGTCLTVSYVVKHECGDSVLIEVVPGAVEPPGRAKAAPNKELNQALLAFTLDEEKTFFEYTDKVGSAQGSSIATSVATGVRTLAPLVRARVLKTLGRGFTAEEDGVWLAAESAWADRLTKVIATRGAATAASRSTHSDVIAASESRVDSEPIGPGRTYDELNALRSGVHDTSILAHAVVGRYGMENLKMVYGVDHRRLQVFALALPFVVLLTALEEYLGCVWVGFATSVDGGLFSWLADRVVGRGNAWTIGFSLPYPAWAGGLAWYDVHYQARTVFAPWLPYIWAIAAAGSEQLCAWGSHMVMAAPYAPVAAGPRAARIAAGVDTAPTAGRALVRGLLHLLLVWLRVSLMPHTFALFGALERPDHWSRGMEMHDRGSMKCVALAHLVWNVVAVYLTLRRREEGTRLFENCLSIGGAIVDFVRAALARVLRDPADRKVLGKIGDAPPCAGPGCAACLEKQVAIGDLIADVRESGGDWDREQECAPGTRGVGYAEAKVPRNAAGAVEGWSCQNSFQLTAGPDVWRPVRPAARVEYATRYCSIRHFPPAVAAINVGAAVAARLAVEGAGTALTTSPPEYVAGVGWGRTLEVFAEAFDRLIAVEGHVDLTPELVLDFPESADERTMPQNVRDTLDVAWESSAPAAQGRGVLIAHNIRTKTDEQLAPHPTRVEMDTSAKRAVNGMFAGNGGIPEPVARKVRIIVPSPPKLAVAILPFVHAFGKWIRRLNKRFVYTPGMSNLEMGLRFTAALARGVEYAYETDGRIWDAHQGRAAQAFALAMLGLFTLFAGEMPLEVVRTFLLPVLMRVDSKRRWAITGFEEPSGRYTTTDMNCIRNLTAQAHAFRRARGEAWAAGDDAAYLFEPGEERNISDSSVRSAYGELFGPMPLEGGLVAIHELSFCSAYFYPVNPRVIRSGEITEWVLGPKIGRACVKIGTTALQGRENRVAATILGSLRGARALYSAVPFLRVLADWLMGRLELIAGSARGVAAPPAWAMRGSGCWEEVDALVARDDPRTWEQMERIYGPHPWRRAEQEFEQALSLQCDAVPVLDGVPCFPQLWDVLIARESADPAERGANVLSALPFVME